MGIYDSVVSVLNKWRKRKRDDNEDHNNFPKRICCDDVEKYVLTPEARFGASDIKQQRIYSDSYVYGEEIQTTESRTCEFKAGGVLFGTNLNMLIQRYASAFFNTDGGVLLAGVDDNGIVKGIRCSENQKQDIYNIIVDELRCFRPYIGTDMWRLKFVPVVRHRGFFRSMASLYVAEITFEKGKPGKIYETGVHEVFIRRDGGVHGPLSPLQMKQIFITQYHEMIAERKKKSNQVILIND